MICSLILDEMFEFDEDYVIEQIQNAYLEGSACRRLGVLFFLFLAFQDSWTDIDICAWIPFLILLLIVCGSMGIEDDGCGCC